MFDNGDGSFQWHFTTNISTVGSPVGFQIFDDTTATWISSDSVGGHGGGSIQLFYSTYDGDGASLWRTVSASGITFVGGGAVADQSGTTT